jgi:enamine deaminase RidA (YjgF/YER057c/UK114 family)
MTRSLSDQHEAGAIVRISSGAPWEPIFGYSRVVKAGDWLAVSGTTATDASGKVTGYGQMYVQARQALSNLAAALGRAGASIDDVVRTRVFVTDLKRFEEVARAHREAFGSAPPASTVVEVRRLVHPDMLVEIEADAYFPGRTERAESGPIGVRRLASSSASTKRRARGKAARPRR